MKLKSITILAALPVALGSCSKEVPEVSERARPVSALTLHSAAPPRAKTATGVIEPFRESDIGFEVAGRLEYVMDIGNEVKGAVLNDDGSYILDGSGAPIERGDVIAAIDSTRYQQTVEATQLKVQSSRLNLDSLAIELDQVLRPDLKSAEAQVEAASLEIEAANNDVTSAQSSFDLAKMTVERDRKLVADSIIPQAQLDTSETEYDQAAASLARAKTAVSGKERAKESAEANASKARGAIKLKESQIETAKAQLAELEVALTQAKTDLEDCVLRAPFSGRITAAHLSRGAYAGPGNPVVTLTLLDPVKVAVTVSANDDRVINIGSRASVTMPEMPSHLGDDGVLTGVVREKSQVADANTRTYLIEIMVRNFRSHSASTSDPAVPLIKRLTPAVERYAGDGGPLYVFSATILEEGGETFVLRMPNLSTLGSEAIETLSAVAPEKVKVTLGDDFFNVINWPFRSLEDPGDLEVGDMLIEDPSPDYLNGVMLDRFNWLFRPGELTAVSFDLGEKPEGFWVPIQAIRERNGTTTVLLIQDGKALEAEVQVAPEPHEELRRIEGEGLQEGARIIVEGVHFTSNGDSVQVVREETL